MADLLKETIKEFNKATIFTFQCENCGLWFAKADLNACFCPKCKEICEVNEELEICLNKRSVERELKR